ncbi:MAG: hypothetical protein R6V27_13950 [Balneolaceae bacterium]
MKADPLNLLTALFLALLLADSVEAQSDIVPAKEQQIAAAVHAAPEPMRDGAAVHGYDDSGNLITLREGQNELICLADDPSDDRFHAACYHKDLEPFMARGRELSAEGHSTEEVREIREQEVEAGDLPMPEKPMSLYSLTGDADAWDYETGTLRSARPLYVVYVPYATVETTGLSASPASEGAPWLMDPGKPWAHIMVGTGRTLGQDAQD